MTEKGTFLQYVPRNFKPDALKRMSQANAIIEEYEGRGLSLTLRQLYYQFVTRKLLPNTKQSYSLLGRLLNHGRLAGLISWTAIEDRTRGLMGLRTYNDPSTAIREARDSYRRDLWANQQYRPEVWIEKESLSGVVSSICNELRVDFFAQRGYNSQSEQWRAGQRFADYITKGQRPIVFHLGDHDPSGVDMTRDNRDRLEMFVGVPVQIVRLALNMPQIEQYNLPPNPTKITDSRSSDYTAEYGEGSWELDALDPEMLRELIRDAVVKIRDPARWEEALTEEADDLRYLEGVLDEALSG